MLGMLRHRGNSFPFPWNEDANNCGFFTSRNNFEVDFTDGKACKHLTESCSPTVLQGFLHIFDHF